MGASITSQAHTAAADGTDFQTKRKPGGQGADAQTHDCEGNKRARLMNANEFLANYKIRPSGSSATPDMVRHLGMHSGRQFEDGRWRNKVDRNVYARRVGRNLIPYWAHIKIPALLMRGDRSNRISP